jgi:uncharacterized membrane protein
MIKVHVVALVCFVVLDALFIFAFGQGLYAQKLTPLLRAPALWWAAVPFYPLFSVALVELVLRGRMQESLVTTGLRGALFGVATYGTYALTNLALVHGWSRTVAAVDLLWGAIVGAAVGTITARLLR